ncbi:hypothetical protein EPA93_22210 [Ktedonosporobacter rubrisoli]|uniref:Uncharacterized protein n=1 Tax=Ktedonosporobacter rubrisoli TaxID=2509675 RepID=A0A4P6JTE2_KTERU|nr:hypothetical protein [Ktedonosporobacter rubrisoli]QBD78560.1 hypothetical protein EPA93_22210 [Ktedonosporobacter rubrisoli]
MQQPESTGPDSPQASEEIFYYEVISLPPAEGRDDIGEGQAGTTNIFGLEPYHFAALPAEGRNDIADDLEDEQRNAFSRQRQQKNTPPAS